MDFCASSGSKEIKMKNEMKRKWLRKYCQSIHYFDQLGAMAKDFRSQNNTEAADTTENMQALYGLLCKVSYARLQQCSKH
jgi:hypothetical protein